MNRLHVNRHCALKVFSLQTWIDGRLDSFYSLRFLTYTMFIEAESSLHVYELSWSKLSKADVIDKVKGVLYGQAIGDAIGKCSLVDLI